MTNQEVLAIKKMVETLWYAKQDSDTDFIWIDFLQDENFVIVSKAVKNLSVSGKEYPPKLPEILKQCENVRLTFKDIKNKKLSLMVELGYLGKKIESEEYQKTLRKIIVWEESGRFPDWLVRDLNNFDAKALTFTREQIEYKNKINELEMLEIKKAFGVKSEVEELEEDLKIEWYKGE